MNMIVPDQRIALCWSYKYSLIVPSKYYTNSSWYWLPYDRLWTGLSHTKYDMDQRQIVQIIYIYTLVYYGVIIIVQPIQIFMSMICSPIFNLFWYTSNYRCIIIQIAVLFCFFEWYLYNILKTYINKRI